MGRPKLPANQKRSEVYFIRLTKSELAQLRRVANAANVQLSEWARSVLLQAYARRSGHASD